ncbi:MAG: hypothetical protein LUE26_06665 [Alistipes sp.]|nr:hypothetical protein [Alistipes sp.]
MKGKEDEKTDDIWRHTALDEAEHIREELSENMVNYHDDPPSDIFVDETPGIPNGMFGDHEDDFDIG